MIPQKLLQKIEQRKLAGNLRSLKTISGLIDFSSNDYLGFAQTLKVPAATLHGATGSRLISGHSEQHANLEEQIATFHNAPAALLFNSGYDANLGLIAAITDRNDIILYDELVHASIRDGITLSQAKSFKFKHNNFIHLKELLEKITTTSTGEMYIITESVFSMDGDMPDLAALVLLSKQYKNVHIILDEAHAVGVIGKKGEGLAQLLGVERDVFARVVTFGKALGSHGAAVLGSANLKTYLVNFARSFIYTTALPPHTLACIQSGYQKLASGNAPIALLQQRIQHFHHALQKSAVLKHCGLYKSRFRESELTTKPVNVAIHCVIIPGNLRVKQVEKYMHEAGYDVRAIISPTVPAGKERLRICLHAFNREEDITNMVNLLAQTLKKYVYV